MQFSGSWDPGEGVKGPSHMDLTPHFTPDPAFVSLEYAENIGDARSPEPAFRESEQMRILALLENF